MGQVHPLHQFVSAQKLVAQAQLQVVPHQTQEAMAPHYQTQVHLQIPIAQVLEVHKVHQALQFPVHLKVQVHQPALVAPLALLIVAA
jgi:RNA:NAD 2'-phosphotransferase (TPT1/KptA family)